MLVQPQNSEKSHVGETAGVHVSKSTLYSYLRHRGVEIGPYQKPARAQPAASTGADEADPPRHATIRLTLRIENNSKFVRGKKG